MELLVTMAVLLLAPAATETAASPADAAASEQTQAAAEGQPATADDASEDAGTGEDPDAPAASASGPGAEDGDGSASGPGSNQEAEAPPEEVEPLAAAVRKLDQALGEKRPRADALVAAMSEVRAAGQLEPSVVDKLLQGACLVALRAKAGSEEYAYAFTLLRARAAAEGWPCDPRQTDTLWRKYKSYFDRKVELRADFAGAFAYLHRWDAVLTTFASVAQSAGARGGRSALLRMRGKVERAIAKLPEEERCGDEEKTHFSCQWTCGRRVAKRLEQCQAKKADTPRQKCLQPVEQQRSACLQCCLAGGPGCRRKSKLICAASGGTTGTPSE